MLLASRVTQAGRAYAVEFGLYHGIRRCANARLDKSDGRLRIRWKVRIDIGIHKRPGDVRDDVAQGTRLRYKSWLTGKRPRVRQVIGVTACSHGQFAVVSVNQAI